jgi:hypothetical protein
MRKIIITIFVLVFITSCAKQENEDFNRFDGPTQAIVGNDGLVYVSDGYFNSRIAVFNKG